jgi:hypothetical protein
MRRAVAPVGPPAVHRAEAESSSSPPDPALSGDVRPLDGTARSLLGVARHLHSAGGVQMAPPRAEGCNTNRLRPPLSPAILVCALLVLAACGAPRPSPSAGPSPTPSTSAPSTAPPTTAAPSSAARTLDPAIDTGILHVETQPAVLSLALRLEYVGSGSSLSGLVDAVDQDTPVSISRALPPGIVGVVANDRACTGSAEVVADLESDAILEVGPSGACSFALSYTHAVGAIQHPIRGAVFGAVVAEGATVVLTPLDPASTTQPIEMVAGPTGIEPMEVPLGQYEVTASADGEVLAKKELDLGPGGDIVLDLMALSKRVPRDCGAIDAVTCESAITAAMSYGHWISPTDVVTAVRLQDTEVMSCDYGLHPDIDVIFRFAGSTRELKVTVGRRDDSDRWWACPPY